MKRILFLIIRLLYRIPGWLLKIRSYNKHIDETTFEERFDFGQKMIRKINSKSRVRIHSFGQENLPAEQGYLIAPNHQGLFDALILFETHDKPFKAIVKKELMSVFVLGNVLKMLQFEAMDRENLRASMKVIKKATQEMSEGRNYVIFPEGTRCRQPVSYTHLDVYKRQVQDIVIIQLILSIKDLMMSEVVDIFQEE